jgi:mannose-1-phosphate guanylyltransferase
LGPNVTIGPNVIVGAGARCSHSIILGGTEIKAHACILYSIVGWNSTIGQWARLEGVPSNSITSSDDVRSGGLTILGAEVTVAPEVIIHSSIVLPHKDLNGNYHNQILL